MATALSQAEIDAIAANGRELLRRQRAAQQPEVVNVDHALALDAPVPLLWDGVEYSVRPLSYREGLRLHQITLGFQANAEKPAVEAEALARFDAFVDESLAFLRSLITPAPPADLFADATPREVGELVSFFLTCLTMQSAGRSSRMGRRSPTTH